MQSKYEVLGIVGEGAYGIVYKCKNKENGEFVAIKKFKETEDDVVKKTMSRELRALQSLKHDNIVEYKEAFKRKGNLYLVFEYVEKNLLEVLQENPRGLDQNLIKNIIYQLCYVIKYLHSLNVIHRDIKPENLLIDSKNKLKLCDFGFARSIKTNKENLTDYVATRWYRAPELLTGEGTYGPEIDYWAIGCIMGELTDGDPLFPGENELDQVKVIQKVIGKLTEEQTELICKKNPKYKFDIIKQEPLERKYMGKLSKVALNFMKALLHPDPKLRLKSENVLQHPYFEEFAHLDPNNELVTNNKDLQNNHSQKQPIPPSKKGNDIKESVSKEKVLIKDKEKEKENTTNQTQVAKKVNQAPVINTTTNINIINYNNFNDNNNKVQNNEVASPKESTLLKSFYNMEEKIQLHDKKLIKKDDLGQTSTSFGRNQIENLASLYGNQNLDGNFKTFYNGEKYNYNIDLNAINNAKSVSPDGIEVKDDKLGKYTYKTIHYNNSNVLKENNGLDYQNEDKKTQNKNIKKKTYESKFKANNVIKEESYLTKVSPPKYEPYNNKAGQGIANKTIYNLQLPTIGNKKKSERK